MGYLDNYKITDSEVNTVHVAAQPDKLTGTPSANKAVFDSYSDLIKSKMNSALDSISNNNADLQNQITNVKSKLTILGTYDTLAALQAAVPTPATGDTYVVGTAASNTCYMWSGTAWVDVGALTGIILDTVLSEISTNGVTNAAITKALNSKIQKFENISVAVADWKSGYSAYINYPYRAALTCSGVLATDIPLVMFAEEEQESGIFIGADSASNTVYIYASSIPSAAITIPVVTVLRP